MKTKLTMAVRLTCILLPCLMGGCWQSGRGALFGTETHWMCNVEARATCADGCES